MCPRKVLGREVDKLEAEIERLQSQCRPQPTDLLPKRNLMKMSERDPLFFDDAEKEKKRVEAFARGLCQTSEPDIFGIVTSTLATAAPGLGPPTREAIASIIAMKIKAAIG